MCSPTDRSAKRLIHEQHDERQPRRPEQIGGLTKRCEGIYAVSDGVCEQVWEEPFRAGCSLFNPSILKYGGPFPRIRAIFAVFPLGRAAAGRGVRGQSA